MLSLLLGLALQEIIRRYSMGPDPVKIQIVSDQVKNFRRASGVNYQDAYYSVDLPIFSIHGNHDDPTREGGELLAALDLLSVSNLVNYFGRQEEVDKVEVSPVLIEKGKTRVALYGLGSMRDERLNRMWQSKKVRFMRPEEDREDNEDDEEDEDDGFFNIFALHQNRDVGRGSKNCVQESMIPEWMDLVVWGHEHECLIDFFESVVGTFRITQPGSSVATSLISGEAVRKKVGILDINGKNFRLHPVPLTQVRSFVTTEVCLREHRANLDADDPKIDSKVTRLLEEEVRLMILNAREKMEEALADAQSAGNNAGEDDSPLTFKMNKPKEVLVRVRVDHNGFTTLNNQRFGAKFVGEVANPTDILLFHRKKDPMTGGQRRATKKGRSALKNPIAPEELEGSNMDDIIREFLDAPEQKMKLMSEPGLSEALELYVEKSVVQSIPEKAFNMLKNRQVELIKRTKKEGNKSIDKPSQVRDAFEQEPSEEDEQPDNASSAKNRQKRKSSRDRHCEEDDMIDGNVDMVDEGSSLKENKNNKLEESDEEEPSMLSSKKRSAASASSRKARTAPQNPKRKAARRRQLVDYDDEDIIVSKEVPKTSARASSARPKRGRKIVNYSLGNSDVEEVSDAASDLLDDDEEDEVLVVDEPPKKRTALSSSRAKKSASASSRKTTTSGTARKSAPSNRSKSSRMFTHRSFDDDSEDDDVAFAGSNADMLEDDWGSAATRSQK